MNDLMKLINEILDNACVMRELYYGWNQYYIELHCVAFTVTARKNDGTWEIGHYTIGAC